jgi:hypothetical protein
MTDIDDEQQWQSAKTFTDLLSLNRMYLMGEISTAPYHVEPIEEPLTPGLLRLHDFGMLTYESQPFKQSSGIDDGTHWERWQKPFVTVIMDNSILLQNIVKKLRDEPDITIWADQVHPYETIICSNPLNVTQYRLAESKEMLEGSQWEWLTSISNDTNLSDLDIFNLTATKERMLWMLDVAATEWGVEIDILKMVERASIAFMNTTTEPQALSHYITVPLEKPISLRKNLAGNGRLDALPPELFTAIAQYLPLEYVKEFRLYPKTHDLAEYALGQYFRVVTVDIGSNAAAKLRIFFETNISRYTRTVIIRKNPRSDWCETRDILKYIRKTLRGVNRNMDKDRNIRVIFKADEKFTFIRQFYKYEGTTEIQLCGPTHIRYIQGEEFVIVAKSEECYIKINNDSEFHTKSWSQDTLMVVNDPSLPDIDKIDNPRGDGIIWVVPIPINRDTSWWLQYDELDPALFTSSHGVTSQNLSL